LHGTSSATPGDFAVAAAGGRLPNEVEPPYSHAVYRAAAAVVVAGHTGTAAERGVAISIARTGSTSPAPNMFNGPNRLALPARILRTSAGVSLGFDPKVWDHHSYPFLVNRYDATGASVTAQSPTV
jgi:hypothetical protein